MLFLFPFDLDEGLDGGDGVDAGVVVEVGELDEEDELLDFDFVLLAVDDEALAVEVFAMPQAVPPVARMSSKKVR